ncbi:MAG: hypothetical protein GXP21_08610 [Gammaproteobacteria bacterium]|nr:hypothetical protein [Gammaproteobacteria bacterium]
MKHLSIGLLTASLVLATVAANAGDMGRLHGYAQGPSASSKSLPLSTVVVIVDDKKKIQNYGRLSAYDMPQRATAGQRKTMPVLAGMKQFKPVKNTEGLGRLNGYGEAEDDFFNIFDTTNMAVWH